MKLKIAVACVAVLIVGLFLWLWLGERSRVASLTSELNQARSESGRVADELAEARRLLERRQGENETLAGESKVLGEKLAGAGKDLASARREVSAAQSQLAEARAGRDQAQADLEMLKKTVEAAQAAQARAEARVSGLEAEAAEAASLKSKLAALLQAGPAEALEAAGSTPGDQADMETWKKALGEAQAEAEKAEAARSAAESQVKRLTEAAAAEPTPDGLAALRRESEQARAELEKVRERLAGDQKLVAELKKERDRLAGETEAARGAVQAARADYERLARDLKAQIDSREVIISELRDELSLSFLDRVFFATGRADVTPEGAKVLDAVAGALKGPGGAGKVIMVVGHTDDLPIARKFQKFFPTNWELSSARAVAVVRYLTEKGGLPPEGLAAEGRSFYQPVVPNDSDETRQKNRRVEIVISNRPAAPVGH